MSVEGILREMQEGARADSCLSGADIPSPSLAGYYPMDFPEELVCAAGLSPIAFFGSDQPASAADGHLQAFADPFARSVLNQLLQTGQRFKWLCFPHFDDTTRVLASICVRSVEADSCDDFILPKRDSSPATRTYLLLELQRIRRNLEQLIGSDIEDEDLAAALDLCEQDRALLRALDELRYHDEQSFSNLEFYSATRSSMLIPKARHIALVEQWLDYLATWRKKGDRSTLGKQGVRVFLSGYLAHPLELFSWLDGLSFQVVGDDLVAGRRATASGLPAKGKPMDRLVERFVALPPSPFFASPDKRWTHLWSEVTERRADGVIFLHPKGMESLNYEYIYLKDQFANQDMPTLRIEIDLPVAAPGWLQTRLETFREIVRAKKG